MKVFRLVLAALLCFYGVMQLIFSFKPDPHSYPVLPLIIFLWGAGLVCLLGGIALLFQNVDFLARWSAAGSGAKRRKSFLGIGIAFGTLLTLIALAVARKPIEVAYHMRALHAGTTFEASEEQRKALIRLGVFQYKEFPLSRSTVTDDDLRALRQMVNLVSLQSSDYTLTMPSNRNTIRITCYSGDLAAWQRVVEAFDGRKSQ
jgi:hypothetical protein